MNVEHEFVLHYELRVVIFSPPGENFTLYQPLPLPSRLYVLWLHCVPRQEA